MPREAIGGNEQLLDCWIGEMIQPTLVVLSVKIAACSKIQSELCISILYKIRHDKVDAKEPYIFTKYNLILALNGK